MKLSEEKKCYNAGKISGLSTLTAYAKFKDYDKLIQEEIGMSPVNPMIHGLNWDRPWLMHMIYNLWMLLRCDAVFFQPNYQESRGARIEYAVSHFFGKRIFIHR